MAAPSLESPSLESLSLENPSLTSSPEESGDRPALSVVTERDAPSATAIAGPSSDPVRDYLQRIGKIRLLTADEEVSLAKRIEVGVLAGDKLKTGTDLDTAHGDTTPGDTPLVRELKWLVQDGKRAMNQFVQSNLRLVVSVAKRYSGHGLPMMDLIQEGNLGLYRAVQKFDYKTGFKFSTYAVWWIKQAINRGQADTTRLIRMPVHQVERLNKLRRVRRELAVQLGREATDEELAAESDLSVVQVQTLADCDREVISLHTLVGDEANSELADLIEDGDSLEIIDIVNAEVRSDELHRQVDALPEREANIVRMRYGLTGRKPMTFEDVGNALGISRERVRQIETRALKLLRCPQLHR